MIYFNIKIQNPWFYPKDDFKSTNYLCWDKKLTNNKNFEIQISKFEPHELFLFKVDFRFWGSDHQGPSFEIDLFGYLFNIQIYDRRHWNWDEDRWQTDEEAKIEEYFENKN